MTAFVKKLYVGLQHFHHKDTHKLHPNFEKIVMLPSLLTAVRPSLSKLLNMTADESVTIEISIIIPHNDTVSNERGE